MRTGQVWLWIAIALTVGMGLSWGSCSKDEPRRADEVEIPNGPRDDRDKEDLGDKDNEGEDPNDDNEGDDNQGNNDNQDLEIPNDLTIVGDWANLDNSVRFHFEENQDFSAYANRSMGFKVSQPSEVDGTYTYSDLKKHLWLSVNDETGGIYVLEFRVEFEGEGRECMHLWSENNRETVVNRR